MCTVHRGVQSSRGSVHRRVHRCAPLCTVQARRAPRSLEPKIARRTRGEVCLSLHSSERRNLTNVRRTQAEVSLSPLDSEPRMMRKLRRTQAEVSVSLRSSARPMMRNLRRPQAEGYEILPNSPPAYIFQKQKYERQTRKTNTKIQRRPHSTSLYRTPKRNEPERRKDASASLRYNHHLGSAILIFHFAVFRFFDFSIFRK